MAATMIPEATVRVAFDGVLPDMGPTPDLGAECFFDADQDCENGLAQAQYAIMVDGEGGALSLRISSDAGDGIEAIRDVLRYESMDNDCLHFSPTWLATLPSQLRTLADVVERLSAKVQAELPAIQQRHSGLRRYLETGESITH